VGERLRGNRGIRISSVDSATYVYDGDGNRVLKNVGGAGTIYWYGAGGSVLGESDLNLNLTAEYIFFNGRRLARIDNPASTTNPSQASLKYYLTDHLGSTSMITDATFSTILEDTDYYPYGREVYLDSSDSNHYKFTGKERDAETGNDYFGARYYASTVGRFLTPDWAAKAVSVPYAEFGDPQSLNLYGYVRNNPLIKVDPDGHQDAPAVEPEPEKPERTAEGNETKEDDVEERFREDNALKPLSPGEAIGPPTPGGWDDPKTGLCYVGTPSKDQVESAAKQPTGKTFDQARLEAFEHAGMKDGKVTFTRADPATGTITEFKGANGAEVGYDKPHDSPGESHDENHVSAQSAGKKRDGGSVSRNFPYSGQQHPSRVGPPNRDSDLVEPHRRYYYGDGEEDDFGRDQELD
jgi:RHS repeat-associated protein